MKRIPSKCPSAESFRCFFGSSVFAFRTSRFTFKDERMRKRLLTPVYKPKLVRNFAAHTGNVKSYV